MQRSLQEHHLYIIQCMHSVFLSDYYVGDIIFYHLGWRIKVWNVTTCWKLSRISALSSMRCNMGIGFQIILYAYRRFKSLFSRKNTFSPPFFLFNVGILYYACLERTQYEFMLYLYSSLIYKSSETVFLIKAWIKIFTMFWREIRFSSN